MKMNSNIEKKKIEIRSIFLHFFLIKLFLHDSYFLYFRHIVFLNRCVSKDISETITSLINKLGLDNFYKVCTFLI